MIKRLRIELGAGVSGVGRAPQRGENTILGMHLMTLNHFPVIFQMRIDTDVNGNFSPTLIWAIPGEAAVTHYGYDIVVDKLYEGSNTGTFNLASDGIDSMNVAGFIGPVPELATILMLLSGLLMLAGIVVLKREK